MQSSRPPPRVSPLPAGASAPSGVDRYEVKSELASGGMGVVYHVVDRVTGEARALKRIKTDVASNRVLVEAFEREYQVLAGLDHPRIIRVFDYGVDQLGPYYTMELLEGQDMQRAAPLPCAEACLCLRDIATSLALLHARRMIHRDLSPTNVRRTPDGHCKLLDFGALAPFGPSGLVVGTAPGIPPEALGGSPLDQRTDLYALGALAYWMLTGRHAYPAKRIEELREVWRAAPPPPSELVEGVPIELDTLVLSLLSADPRARPASAAEVIARLGPIADLPPEDELEAEQLARSFLSNPRFIGRLEEIAGIRRRAAAAVEGKGSAVLVDAAAGMGRTRFLEEVGVHAQLAGASVLRIDASMYRQARGTARALAVRAFEAFPELARKHAATHRQALASLGGEIDARLPAHGTLPPGVPSDPVADSGGSLEGWFASISDTRPLVILVDNVEYADPPSLGLVAALAKASADHPLLLVVTELARRDGPSAAGLPTLRGHCVHVSLPGLSATETLDLAHSLFGDAPNVNRFAEWLHGATAGSPLYSMELSRQLVARGVLRYMGGMWVLPLERPDVELPAGLEGALSARLGYLSDEARRLAECLSLQREQATLELCRLLFDDREDRHALSVLDELSRADIVHLEDDRCYRFTSTALREALYTGMPEERREANHRRLGEAFTRLAGPTDHALRIEAGWHLIRGGDSLRGADEIATVTHDSVVVRTLIANLHHAGKPIEAALRTYKHHRRFLYERTPLLAALAHAGYYEDRQWGELYGDEALDALEEMSGLRAARRLRRFLGRPLALIVGVVLAFVRFHLAPKRERGYPFRDVFVQLFGAVTALTGSAAILLDVERAARVADVLEPFAFLPERLTPVGIYRFCLSLQEIGREHQAAAYDTFDTLIARFEDKRYYRSLPDDARVLYSTAAHFSRGAFAVFRADGRGALASAAALDACGLKLYQMIASQIRFLYYTNRGEVTRAAEHPTLDR